MITHQDIDNHAEKYPTFNKQRLIDWLDKKEGRWYAYDNVSKANQDLHGQMSRQKLFESMTKEWPTEYPIIDLGFGPMICYNDRYITKDGRVIYKRHVKQRIKNDRL
jgi:hypothetical protein